MGRAQLKSLKHSDLEKLLWGIEANVSKPVGFKTTVERDIHSVYIVRHHGSPVAKIFKGYWGVEVEICNWGWHSVTTAHRINAAMVDNGVPLRCAIRGGIMRLINHNTGEIRDDHKSLQFKKGNWVTVSLEKDKS